MNRTRALHTLFQLGALALLLWLALALETEGDPAPRATAIADTLTSALQEWPEW